MQVNEKKHRELLGAGKIKNYPAGGIGLNEKAAEEILNKAEVPHLLAEIEAVLLAAKHESARINVEAKAIKFNANIAE